MLSLDEWIALLETGKATVEAQVIVTSCVVAVALIVTFVYENWLRKVIEKIIWRSRNTWDDYVLSDKLMRSLGYFIPLVIIYEALPYSLVKGTFVYVVCYRVLLASLIAMVAHCLGLIISGVNDKIQASDATNRPTSGVFQMIKIIVWCLAAILIIAALADKDPRTLLAGLTAFAAVLSLVFKDTIMGLVAGVQLAAYDMIHVGDWIAVDKYGIDGVVEEVTLNIVKVRNWDNTVGTIPPHLLMSESFKNYSRIFQDKARRISLEFYIDFNSVRLCSSELEESLKEKGLYASKDDVECDVEESRKVNLTLFSRYIEKFLNEQSFVRKDKFFLARVKQPTPTGLPLEIYCYVDNVAWKHFEHTQSRVVEHLIAVMPEFELRIFQSPAGMDFNAISVKKAQ